MKEYFAFIIGRISSLFEPEYMRPQPEAPKATEPVEGGDPERLRAEKLRNHASNISSKPL